MSWIEPKPIAIPESRILGKRTNFLMTKPPKPPKKKRVLSVTWQRFPRKVKLRGKVYESIQSAAEDLKLHHSTIKRMINSGKGRYL